MTTLPGLENAVRAAMDTVEQIRNAPVVSFHVIGTPAPQGSKTRMPNGAIIEGKTAAQRQRHTNWRAAVADAASKVAPPSPLTGPLRLTVDFRFTMPQSRRKVDRVRGWCWKVSAPDLDKVLRATGDALTESGVIRDDALFAEILVTKREVVGWTGATIRIDQMSDTDQMTLRSIAGGA